MKVVIVGFGVVGSGVAEVLRDNAAAIARRCKTAVELGYIVDLRRPTEEWVPYWTPDFATALADPEVGIVVEAIGGLHPAYDFTKAALESGRAVVTSNKELVATLGTELLAVAKEHDTNYFFEASVGGGIPLLHPLARLLGTEEITAITGILNGTTNFIMTRMNEDSMSFEDALALAQKNGYAEADPTADIEGHDACRKTAILASLLTHCHVSPEDVYTEGITKLTGEDAAAASASGYAIKLLGQVRRGSDGLLAQVTPALVPAKSPLGVTSDVFNAVLVHGTHLGDAMFYGRGAGKLPTANAVVSDVVEAVCERTHLDLFDWEKAPVALRDASAVEFHWMIRMAKEDAHAAAEAFGAKASARNVGEEAVLFTMKLSMECLARLRREAAAQGVEVRSALRVLEL
jgi:homoserine dehydrogenase